MVFLQHGVIKDDMSLTLNRYNTNFTGFITSTQGEYKSILEYPYFYSEKEVWCTGLPVFDELEDRAQKIILVMPTWRQELMQQKWNDEKNVMEWIPSMDIKSSSYYKHYYSLLHNQKLQGTCKRYGYKIAFKSHPLLESYISEIADDKKTYVINRKMYISDWAMKQNKDVLMHIVIHEIIHILNPEYTEEKVIEETDKKFSKLRNLSEWKVFL